MISRGTFRTAIDPRAPRKERRRLREARRYGNRAHDEWSEQQLRPWLVAGTVSFATMVVLLVVGMLAWGWSVTRVMLAVTLLAGVAALAAGAHRVAQARWLVDTYLILPRDQHAAARRHRSVAQRLALANSLVAQLHRHRLDPALTGLIDIDEDLVDRIHHELVSPLVAASGLASTIADAARYPELADRVRCRREEFAAVEAAADARLAQVRQLVHAADAVRARLDELDRTHHRAEQVRQLAQRLDGEAAPDDALGSAGVPGDELDGPVGAARAALELLLENGHVLPRRATV